MPLWPKESNVPAAWRLSASCQCVHWPETCPRATVAAAAAVAPALAAVPP